MSFLQRIIDRSKVTKIRNYAAYAIGEILLVVIGIILAVQINEWQESVRNQKALIQHYNNIILNLEADLLDLDRILQASESAMGSAESLIRQLQTLEPISNRTGAEMSILLYENTFNPIRTGMEGLNNSGLIGLVDVELSRELLKYYWLCDRMANRESINNSFIREHYERYCLDNYPEIFQGENSDSIVVQYYKLDPRSLPHIKKDTFLEDRKLEALIVARLFQSKSVNKLYRDAILLSNYIKSRIQKKIV